MVMAISAIINVYLKFSIMKTRITTTVLLIALFLSVTAFASSPVPVPASKAVAASVANLIEDELRYPGFAVDDMVEGDVVVDLIIQEDGTFDVKAANSVNSDLKEHVIKAIEDMENENHSQYAGQQVLLKVTFELK